MTKKPRQGRNGVTHQAATPTAASRADSIAIGLQKLFATVAQEPVPDEFMALLERIDAEERARQGNGPPPADGDKP